MPRASGCLIFGLVGVVVAVEADDRGADRRGAVARSPQGCPQGSAISRVGEWLMSVANEGRVLEVAMGFTTKNDVAIFE